MAAYDLILRGATVAGTGALAGPAPADVAVSDGRIVTVASDFAETETVFQDGEIVSRPLGRLLRPRKAAGKGSLTGP